MLEACYEVLRGYICVCGTLGSIPLNTLTDVEGIYGTVGRDIPALSKSGCHLSEIVVLNKTVYTVYSDLCIRLGAGVEPVKRYRCGLEGCGIILLNGMSLGGKVCSRIVLALACNCLSPLSEHVCALLGSAEFIRDNHALKTVIIVTPLNIRNGSGSYSGNGVCAALSRGGDHTS